MIEWHIVVTLSYVENWSFEVMCSLFKTKIQQFGVFYFKYWETKHFVFFFFPQAETKMTVRKQYFPHFWCNFKPVLCELHVVDWSKKCFVYIGCLEAPEKRMYVRIRKAVFQGWISEFFFICVCSWHPAFFSVYSLQQSAVLKLHI